MKRFSYYSHNWLIHRVNNRVVETNRRILRDTCIDLGCGDQPYRSDTLATAEAYIGVDWPHSLHDQKGVDVFADLNMPRPFGDGQADTVTAFQVMEHLSEPTLFLSECFRILKAGGAVLLTVPFMWHVHEEPHDYFHYARYGLEYLLTKAGFDDVEVVENTGFWQTWILKVNYHSLHWCKGALRYVVRPLLVPLWWLGQCIAPILDKVDARSPGETASYTVVARRTAISETWAEGSR